MGGLSHRSPASAGWRKGDRTIPAYSKHLWDVGITNDANPVSPAVPAGKVWVVRYITANLYPVVAGDYLVIEGNSSGMHLVIYIVTPSPPPTYFFWDRDVRIVLDAGQALDTYSNRAAAHWNLTMDGYELGA